MRGSLQPDSAGIGAVFARENSFPFILLIILQVFSIVRPDRLLPGGSILIYLPTAILVILLLIWVQRPGKVLFNSQTKLFIGMIAVMALGVFLARNKSWAYYLVSRFVLYIFVPYLMIIQFVDSSDKVFRFVRIYLIASVFVGILGIVHDAVITVPSLHDENDFALLMNILIPIGYFFGQEANGKWKKTFFYSLTMIFLIGNITSFSRGGFAGLAAVALFIFAKSKQKFLALLLMLIFATAILICAPAGYWEEMKTIESQGAQEGTGRARVEMWKAGLRMFLDNPVLGVGPQNFGIWLPDYYVSYDARQPENLWGRAAHSLYVTLLAETGLVGTLLFMLMTWSNYRNHRYIATMEKKKTKILASANLEIKESEKISGEISRLYYLSLGYSGAMIGYFVTGAFLSVLWYGYFWMLTSFWVMSSNSVKKIEKYLIEEAGTTGRNETGYEPRYSTKNGQIGR